MKMCIQTPICEADTSLPDYRVLPHRESTAETPARQSQGKYPIQSVRCTLCTSTSNPLFLSRSRYYFEEWTVIPPHSHHSVEAPTIDTPDIQSAHWPYSWGKG